MKACLILVDGLTIAKRSEVAKEIERRFPKDAVDRYQCDNDTPAHLYVHMMRGVLENGRSAIIENGWRADAVLDSLGDKFKVPRQFRRMLDRIALAVNGQVAMCHAGMNKYAENWAVANSDRPFMDIVEGVEKIEKAWKSLPLNGLKQTIIHTGDMSFMEDIDLLLDRAKLKAGNNIGPGIGNWSPGEVVLMVGDRHGPSIQPYQINFNLAFCDMAKAGSSYWLSDKLDEGQIPEERLYWINAYDKNGQETSVEFVEWLKPIAIFTLGDSAAKWCEKHRLRHEQFTHPQWHKRFMHHSPYPLISRLRDVVGGTQ